MDPAPSSTRLREVQLSERLNRECFCITPDRDALCKAVEREVGDPDFCEIFIKTRPHLFSNVPVFLSESDIAGMRRVVRAVEAVARLPGYRNAVLSWAPEVARRDHGPLGVFMGYDFHLAGDGPKLIEVNTNAGGAFLNALLVQAQRACCAEVEAALTRSGSNHFDTAILNMFQHEWTSQKKREHPVELRSSMIGPRSSISTQSFCWLSAFFRSMVLNRKSSMLGTFDTSAVSC
jgi:hypothetical protein